VNQSVDIKKLPPLENGLKSPSKLAQIKLDLEVNQYN